MIEISHSLETKTLRQKEAAEKFRHSKDYGCAKNGSGTFQAVTGFGKTYLAIEEVIKPFLTVRKTQDCIILVAREQHQSHWNAELDKRIKDIEMRKRVKVYTVQFLIKNRLKLFTNLFIVDELHKFYSEEFGKYIDTTYIQFDFNLGLTATFKDVRGNYKKYLEWWRPFDVISQKEALEKGWISQFIEYNLGIDLTKEEIKEHNFYQDELNKYLIKFGDHGLKGASLCYRGGIGSDKRTKRTSKQWCARYAESMGWNPALPSENEINQMWNPGAIFGYAKKVVTNHDKLNNLLHTCDSKFRVAMEVLETFKQKRVMVFGQSTAFADALTEAYNTKQYGTAVCFHTQLESKTLYDLFGEPIKYQSGKRAGQVKVFGITTLKKQALSKFAKGTANALITVSALDENFDCPDLELGLIVARTRNPNQQIQRGGRIKRLQPKDPDAIALIINLYCKSTKDYDWLRHAQGESDHYIKYINSVEDIDFIEYTEDVYDIANI